MSIQENEVMISVIMGIYNCAGTLSEAIESILNQTITNWELIMCDDGSTDDTYNVAKEYALVHKEKIATVYKGNIIKNLIMDCQSYTKYRPNETTGGIFVSWRRKEELPTGA